MIAPIIDELAVEYEGKLKCVKLNTDESPQVATDYGIRSIPTVSEEAEGGQLRYGRSLMPMSSVGRWVGWSHSRTPPT